jgi:hypothetical protein
MCKSYIPENVNSVSPPAKPGVYLRDHYWNHPIISGENGRVCKRASSK